ncbi:hypothetical protein [Thermofilum sp.]|uniref:hypothetical protein n=1 Tax=Thermofilum sp. TaxID=1961369 RepID=UPI00258988B2|nr:hypothetical protein [Thermofilum sp.]
MLRLGEQVGPETGRYALKVVSREVVHGLVGETHCARLQGKNQEAPRHSRTGRTPY